MSVSVCACVCACAAFVVSLSSNLMVHLSDFHNLVLSVLCTVCKTSAVKGVGFCQHVGDY